MTLLLGTPRPRSALSHLVEPETRAPGDRWRTYESLRDLEGVQRASLVLAQFDVRVVVVVVV